MYKAEFLARKQALEHLMIKLINKEELMFGHKFWLKERRAF